MKNYKNFQDDYGYIQQRENIHLPSAQRGYQKGR